MGSYLSNRETQRLGDNLRDMFKMATSLDGLLGEELPKEAVQAPTDHDMSEKRTFIILSL